MAYRIVFIGDSLTQWYDWENRFPGHDVVNLGISGETVEGLLNRRDRIRTQIGEPDYLFLMTGINNIANGQYEITVPYDEIVRNFTTWFKHSTVIAQSILPIELSWISNDVIIRANHEIAFIARKHSAEYLDVFSLFMDSKDHSKKGFISDDGVHLASRGYEAWANEVERFITEHPK